MTNNEDVRVVSVQNQEIGVKKNWKKKVIVTKLNQRLDLSNKIQVSDVDRIFPH